MCIIPLMKQLLKQNSNGNLMEILRLCKWLHKMVLCKIITA